jgi:hypothetical protein
VESTAADTELEKDVVSPDKLERVSKSPSLSAAAPEADPRGEWITVKASAASRRAQEMADPEGQAVAEQEVEVRSYTRTNFCRNSVRHSNGYSYATLDATSKDATATDQCQHYYVTVPADWQVAPAGDSGGIAVTAAYPWGARALFFADRKGVNTAQNSPPGGVYARGDTYATSSGNQWQTTGDCNKRILIKSLSLATCDCPAGKVVTWFWVSEVQCY